MFLDTRQGLALALPAALFALLMFLVPVAILLSEAFRADGGWSLAAYLSFSQSR